MNNRSYRYDTVQLYENSYHKDNYFNVNELGLKENYENLANGIIISACKDYKNLYGRLLILQHTGQFSTPRYEQISNELDHLEKFFHSKYFSSLTSNNPDLIIKGLEELATEKFNYKIKYDSKYTDRMVKKITKESVIVI